MSSIFRLSGLLLLLHAGYRAVLVALGASSPTFVAPVRQVALGLLNDVFIVLLVTLTVAALARAFGKTGRVIGATLVTLLIMLLAANVARVHYSSSNLIPNDFSYLRDAPMLIDSVKAELGAVALGLVSLAGFGIPLVGRLTGLLAEVDAALRRMPRRRLIKLLLASFVLAGGLRSAALASRFMLFEPIETHPLTFLAWRASIQGRQALSYPERGFAAVKDWRAALLAAPAREFPGLSGAPLRAGDGTVTNVVLIVLESAGAIFVSEERTPFLWELGQRGVSFTNHFTNAYRTCGAIFSLLCSRHEPLSFFVARDYPYSVTPCLQQRLAHEGYSTTWVSGAPSSFDHMGAWLKTNGFARIVAEEDLPSELPRSSYGVHDGPMLSTLLGEIDRAKKPAFVTALTVTTHGPYTLPEGYLEAHPEIRSWLPHEQAFHYVDAELARFFAEAETKAWYDETLFVVVGDHLAWGHGAFGQEASHEDFRGAFRVYSTMFHPKRLAPQRYADDTSHVNVAPTILDLLGLAPQGDFLGEALQRRPQSTYTLSQNHVRDSWFIAHKPDATIQRYAHDSACYHLSPGGGRRDCDHSERTEVDRLRETMFDTLQWDVLSKY